MIGSMAVNRDEFFAELDKLTDRQIEERLPLWDRERLILVQEYIDGREGEPMGAAQPLEPARKQPETDSSAKDAALVALAAAKKANTVALSALIISLGAMLTAVMAGAMVYLILNN